MRGRRQGRGRHVLQHTRDISQGHIKRSFLGLQRVGDDSLAIFRDFPPDPAHVAAQPVFGGCAYHEDALEIMGEVSWPLMWLQGDSCDGRHVAGTQAMTVKGLDIRRLQWQGRIMGSFWSDDDADYCCMAGVTPAHPGDVPAQIDLTMRVVQAILESRGMSWESAARGTAYFQHMGDAPLLTEYSRAHGIPDLPVINAHATICRSDLLFEIELDAMVSRD